MHWCPAGSKTAPAGMDEDERMRAPGCCCSFLLFRTCMHMRTCYCFSPLLLRACYLLLAAHAHAHACLLVALLPWAAQSDGVAVGRAREELLGHMHVREAGNGAAGGVRDGDGAAVAGGHAVAPSGPSPQVVSRSRW
jgi:hypothetical protein